MPNTITSYITFSPATKAKSEEVNSNFLNHRGTLLPINEDTATASENTHDLGSTDHRWKDFYANKHIIGDPTYANKVRTETTGSMIFERNTTTSAELQANGFTPISVQSRRAISASTGDWTTGNTSTVNTFSDVTNLSVSITTTGKPVYIGLMAASGATSSGIHFGCNTSGSGSPNPNIEIAVIIDLATSAVYRTRIVGGSFSNNYGSPVSSINFLSDLSAGSHDIKIQARIQSTYSTALGYSLTIQESKLYAYET